MIDFTASNALIAELENVIKNPKKLAKGSKIKVGVDLGTMFTVIVVCDEHNTPICCKMRQTNVVRDGVVVDYMEARKVVLSLKQEVEEAIGLEITKASIAIPPKTIEGSIKTHCYVVEGAGLEVVSVEDEPVAANKVLGLIDGAVIDIGGGTTGTSVFQKGQVVASEDDATGGMHCTYVIAGNFKVSIEEAEAIKVDPSRKEEITSILTPVIEKMASIILKHIEGFNVKQLVLCGGTSCIENIEEIVEKYLKIKTYKPQNPFLITPLGIAMSCTPYVA